MIRIMKYIVVGLIIHSSCVHASDITLAQVRERVSREMREQQQDRPLDNERIQLIAAEALRVRDAIDKALNSDEVVIFNPELVRRYQLTQEEVASSLDPELGVYPTIEGFMIGDRSLELSRPDEDSESDQELARVKDQVLYAKRAEFFQNREKKRSIHADGQALPLGLILQLRALQAVKDPEQMIAVVFPSPSPLARAKRKRGDSQSPKMPFKIPRMYYVPGLNSPRTPLTWPRTPAESTREGKSPNSFSPGRISSSLPPLPGSLKSPMQ